MAGLPWIKVMVVLPNHPKLQRLEKRMGLEDGLGLLTRLWCWTATYYPDGLIPISAVEGLERFINGDLTITYARMLGGGVEAGGPPRNGETVGCLVECGWLDPLDEGERYRVHDWEEFQSAHADKAEREREQVRERVRKFRNRKRNAKQPLLGNAGVAVTGNAVTAEREREKEKEIRSTLHACKGKLGPLGSQLVREVEAGLGHGLIPAKNGQAEKLESLVPAFGGVAEAKEFVAAICRRGGEPKSVGWLVKVLSESVPSATQGGA